MPVLRSVVAVVAVECMRSSHRVPFVLFSCPSDHMLQQLGLVAAVCPTAARLSVQLPARTNWLRHLVAIAWTTRADDLNALML